MKKNYQNKKYLLIFFAATLLWTWISGFLPLALNIVGTPLGNFLFYFGGGAPTVVGLILVFTTYPKAAIKDYFKKCFFIKKKNIKWILLTVIFFTLIVVLGILLGYYLFKLEMPEMKYLKDIIKAPYMIFPILIISLISGPLNEEFGWRGYSLDKLLLYTGFHKSSIILGFIWAIWHLAWYFTPGQAQYEMLKNSIFEAFLFIPSVILLNYVVSMVYIKTERSILCGALVHMFSNLITSQLISPYSASMGTIIRCVSIIFCLIVVIYTSVSAKFKVEVETQIHKIKIEEIAFSKAL